MSAADATTATASHILVFPFPAQGHLLPLLDLTNQLALHGLKITILVTPKNLSSLTPLLSAHPSIQTLVLPFPHHPKLPLGVENVKDIGSRGIRFVAAALGGLRGPIIEWFNAHPSPPRVILSDFFLGWTQHLAEELGILRVAFYSSGSFLSAVNAVLFSHFNRYKSLEIVEFKDLPGSPAFKEEHLPSTFRFCNESDSDWRFFMDSYNPNMASWGCVFNSFDALEGNYLEHFKKLIGHGRVYGVGPLSLAGGSGRVNRVSPDSPTSYEVLNWLDNCPDGSVLYVSFGSQKWLTEPQLQALGLALERSGTRFIWVVRARPDAQGGRTVLDEYEEQVAGRGLVVKGWAPQVEILSHRAVSGFLSHCGWNSVLESVVAGVMILAWPTEADQFVNARLLVEDMGVAVRACEGPDTVPDPDELGRVIREVMSGDMTQKQRARELKEKAVAAVNNGGSSVKDLEDLVNELAMAGAKKNS